MSWPWRRARGRHSGPAPRPVAEVRQPETAVATPAVAPVAVPALAPPAESPSAGGPDIRLGFDDGTEVHLAPGDPRAQALRHVADVLLHGGGS